LVTRIFDIVFSELSICGQLLFIFFNPKKQFMATIDEATGFIRQFITSVGVDPATCYNEQNKAWYLNKGSASIEIFLSSQPTGQWHDKEFSSCFLTDHADPR
jgi:hypothetical protein